MSTSRRTFITQSTTLVGGVAIAGFNCNSAGRGRESFVATQSPGPDAYEPSYLSLEREGELARREEELWEVFRSCALCPRQCEVNRLNGETGVCSMTSAVKYAGIAPHFGEEAPLVGRWGSGTVFFSHCNLLCVFCQNWEINHRGDGQVVSHRRLAEAMISLQERGCHNINLVTPTHVVPNIIKALRIAIKLGLRVPLVYNTGGFDNINVIRKLDGIVDIYLPDFKYQNSELAATYSFEADAYPVVAKEVIREMHRQVGELKIDRAGVAQRGLIIRHLVMPENIAGTQQFVRWVAKELGPDVSVNIMAQYRPEHRASEYPEINRGITSEEWQQALEWARDAGLNSPDL